MTNSVDFETKRSFVQKQTVFSKLTDKEMSDLADLLTEKHFKTGDTIVTEGDPVDSIYLIVSGTADVRHITIKDNAPQITSLATLTKGNSIGLNETGFYSLSGVRTATVVATSDMVTLYLSMPRFHGFALAYPHVNEIMHKNSEKLLEDITKEFNK